MKRTFLLIISVILFLSVAITVSAKTDNPNANDNAQIPEENGDYAVPGRPELRVRVFVHKQNARKVKPTPVPATCYDPDLNVATIRPAGWTLPASMRYKLNEASAPSSVRSGVLSFVIDDFAAWTNAINNSDLRPDINYDGPTAKTRYKLDGENIIAWGKTLPTTLGVTYIWYNPQTYEAVEIDTIMNSKVSWSLNCDSSYNAENIMIHEIGHWYGLGDEYASSYADDTMFGYGSKAETKKKTLEIGDITGINNIYKYN